MNNKYFPFLDALRCFAILFVVVSHMGLGHIIPGGFGVTLFFFISGFLITRLLIVEFEKNNSIDIKKFYIRRFLRLYPALLLMLLLSCGVIFFFECHVSIKPYIFSGLFYYTNYYILFFREAAEGNCSKIFDILWSLSIEEHFYLLFPFLFSFLYKRSNNLIWTLLGITVITLIVRLYLLHNSTNIVNTSTQIYFSTHTRADSIIYGCLSALILYKLESRLYISFLKSKLSIAIGLILILFTFLYRDANFRETFRYSIQGVALAFLVPSLLFVPETSVFRRLLENKTLVFVGRLSYSIYLFHWVSIVIVNNYFTEFSPPWMICMVLSTLLLSLSSYYLIERPFVSFRRKYGSNAK